MTGIANSAVSSASFTRPRFTGSAGSGFITAKAQHQEEDHAQAGEGIPLHRIHLVPEKRGFGPLPIPHKTIGQIARLLDHPALQRQPGPCAEVLDLQVLSDAGERPEPASVLPAALLQVLRQTL